MLAIITIPGAVTAVASAPLPIARRCSGCEARRNAHTVRSRCSHRPWLWRPCRGSSRPGRFGNARLLGRDDRERDSGQSRPMARQASPQSGFETPRS